MNTDARSKIIETIAKLAALTNPDANAFQGEINNAATKIQELMDKYSISQDELQSARVDASRKVMDESFDSKSAEYVIKGIKAWHWMLARVIAKITHTKHFASGYGTQWYMKFFGTDENSTIAASLFVEWVQVIEAMAISATDDYWKVVMKKYNYAGFLAMKKREGWGRRDKFMDNVPYEERTTYYKSSWLDGCVSAINKAVDAQEKKRSSEVSTALVLYDEKIETAYKALSLTSSKKSIRGNTRGHSPAGYEAGMEAGSSIKIGLTKVGG